MGAPLLVIIESLALCVTISLFSPQMCFPRLRYSGALQTLLYGAEALTAEFRPNIVPGGGGERGTIVCLKIIEIKLPSNISHFYN